MVKTTTLILLLILIAPTIHALQVTPTSNENTQLTINTKDTQTTIQTYTTKNGLTRLATKNQQTRHTITQNDQKYEWEDHYTTPQDSITYEVSCQTQTTQTQYSITCQDHRISFAQAHYKQGLTVTIQGNTATITNKTGKISIIDPTITITDNKTYVQDDTYVQSSSPDNNYNEDDLKHGYGATGTQRIYIEVNVSSINWTTKSLQSAQLSLNQIHSGGTPDYPDSQVYNCTHGINEATLTWNNQPCTTWNTQSNLRNFTHTGYLQTVQIDITKPLNDSINENRNHVTIIIKKPESSESAFMNGDDTESDSTHPSVNIQYYQYANQTVHAYSNQTNKQIPNINATICKGTTCYNLTTTNGTAHTNEIETTGTKVNITYNAPGFQQRNITNHNTTQLINYSLQQTNFTITSHQVTGTNKTQTNNTMTCTYTNPTPYTATTNYHVSNKNDTTHWQSTTGKYLINQTDYADQLEYTCQPCTTYGCTNSTPITTLNDHIDSYITLRVVNYNQEELNQTNLTISAYDVRHLNENNMTYNMSKFINSSNKTVTTLLEIYDYINNNNADYIKNITIHELNTTMTFQMSPNELKIQFPEHVSGVVADTQKSRWFNESLLLIVQSGLETGQVNLMFNGEQGNYTQFYEYINDQETYIDEDVYLIDTPDTLAYLKAQDLAGAPIENALIRLYQYKPNSTTYETRELIGQRLTDSNGQTLFVLDSETQVVIITTKEDYTITTQIVNVMELDTTHETPYLITMTPSGSNTISYDSYYIPPTITNTSEDLQVRVYSPDALTLQLTTTYARENGTETTQMTEGELSVWTGTLTAGTHYQLGGTSDITVEISKNGAPLINKTIKYYEHVQPKDFLNLKKADIPTNLYNAYILTIFLTVIGLSSFTGIRMNSKTAGATTFLILSLVASLLDPRFLWIVLVGLISVIGTILYKNNQS